MSSREAVNTYVLVFVFNQPRIGLAYIFAQGKHADHYTTETVYTTSGKNYSDDSNFPYIFRIKLPTFKIFSWSQFMSDFDKKKISTQAELNVV